VSNNLGYLMQGAVAAHPQRVALIELAPGSTEIHARLTYAELDAALDRVAAGALRTGLVPGDRVIVSTRNRMEFVLAVFGMQRAGVVPVIVNPRLSAADIDWLTGDVGAVGIIGDEVSLPFVADSVAAAALPCRIAVGASLEGWTSWEDWLTSAPFAPHQPHDNEIGIIGYTSGSTGRPKGVLLTHKGQVDSFNAQKAFYDKIYTKPSVNLIAAPMFHKNGTGNVKTAFVMHGTVVIMPRFDPAAMLNAVPALRVTTFTAVATMLIMMLKHQDLISSLDFSSLNSIMVGAAPTGRVLLDRVEGLFGTRVFHMYGTTESGATLGHDPLRRYSLDSCGKPLPGVEARLIGPDGKDSEDEGELWVRTPALARGYQNRPETTAERFREGGWYATGDILARDAEGYYFFRGRTDDMFVCGGENIYPMEVERLILLHPGVANACVAPVPHPTKNMVPVAAVVLKDLSVTAEDLKAWALERGPAYAHPRWFRFDADLPVAPTGKVDRKAIVASLTEDTRGMFDGDVV
jgi:acyl-CoA synthetase (AMP-forming)/AMP-acid ligase II